LKYFWVVGSFGGVPSSDVFAKRYELHYQPKKVEIDEGILFVQYGCLNFHAKRDGGLKLSLAIKNKWSSRWMNDWFYCRAPCLCHSGGGKSVYALHSWISTLDYMVELEVECPDSDMNDAAFICATVIIGGCDVIKEFIACGMYPLASSFGFKDVIMGTMVVSKVKTPLPIFPVEPVSAEDGGCFLTKMEMNVERILGIFGPKEHDVLMIGKLLNGGRHNRVFERMGITYVPLPLPGTKASHAATQKRKADMSKKVAVKKLKVAQSVKVHLCPLVGFG
jgi:hypothetical protein